MSEPTRTATPATPAADVVEALLAASGTLKLRAKARVAEGGADALFEASVLLHEAARTERRALEAMPHRPPSARLATSIEECWCLVEGRDPARADEAWSRVLEELPLVDRETGEAMLARLRPRHEESQRAYRDLMAACPHLIEAGQTRVYLPPTKEGQRAVLREIERVLKAFPGAVAWWWDRHRLLDAMGEPEKSRQALERARLLDPDVPPAPRARPSRSRDATKETR